MSIKFEMITQSSILSFEVKERMLCPHFYPWPSLRLMTISSSLVHGTWDRKSQVSLRFGGDIIQTPSLLGTNPSSLLARDCPIHQILLHRSFDCLINFSSWCHESQLSFFLVAKQSSTTFLLSSSCHSFLYGKWSSSYLKPLSYDYFYLIVLLLFIMKILVVLVSSLAWTYL